MNQRESIVAIVYTTADLKRLLQASTRTIQRWAQQGRLPAPVMPGRWLRSEVDQLLTPHSTIERQNQQSSDTTAD